MIPFQERGIIPLTLFIVVCLISGCISTPSWQQYENPEIGIKMEKPKSWDVTYHERSGSIFLEEENWLSNDSARIEIIGNACVPIPDWFNGSREAIEADIDRIRILYNLDSVTILQEPINIETGEYEVIKAIIAIPTMSMPENDARIQIGNRDSNLFQSIELLAIRDKNHFLMAYIYKGDSKALNAEAEEIVSSIQLTCSE